MENLISYILLQIQQHCFLKHVKSLWMTLSFHRSYIMVRQGKPVEVMFNLEYFNAEKVTSLLLTTNLINNSH